MADVPRGGKTGKKMGNIHATFHDRLQDLQTQARQMHNALQGKAQRQWQIPQGYSRSLMAISSLHSPAFDRTAINDNYEAATRDPANPGTVGDVIGLKLQIDYVACEERAFRARHASYCRTVCLGHARRYGQGQGSLWDGKMGIEGLVAGYIAGGGSTTTEAAG